MPRPFTPKIITANALIEGDVIYLSPTHDWVRDLQSAQVFHDETSTDAALRHAVGQSNVAVGVYATDIAVENGVLRTTHFREEFRKTGPSNYFHGKPEHDTNVSV
jgi:hypothetical protein